MLSRFAANNAIVGQRIMIPYNGDDSSGAVFFFLHKSDLGGLICQIWSRFITGKSSRGSTPIIGQKGVPG